MLASIIFLPKTKRLGIPTLYRSRCDGHISNECESIPAPAYHPQGQWDNPREWRNPREPMWSPHRPRGTGESIHTSEHKPTGLRMTTIASSESFRRRLMIPEVCRKVQESLHRVVLMRFTRQKAPTGAPARFIQLIQQMARPRELQFIGAQPPLHPPNNTSRLQGRGSTPFISPRSNMNPTETGGTANHVLVRPGFKGN